MRRIVVLLSLVFIAAPLWPASSSVVLAHRGSPPAYATFTANSPAALTVPAETLVKAQLLTGMHTLVSHVNDPIAAEMIEPVYIEGRVALPAGTLFDGHITAVHAPRRLGRDGEIAFRFDHVTLPDGSEIPVSAVIASMETSPGLSGKLDSEGHMKGQRRHSWRSFLTGFLGVGGLTAAKVAVASSTALTIAAPASAATFLGYEFFLRRGGNVNVPPQTRCHIRLNASLTIPSLG